VHKRNNLTIIMLVGQKTYWSSMRGLVWAILQISARVLFWAF